LSDEFPAFQVILMIYSAAVHSVLLESTLNKCSLVTMHQKMKPF